MNTHYVEPKTRPTNRKPKLLGIPRPIIGAIIGFASFLIMITPFLLQDFNFLFPFISIDAVVLGPGLLTFIIFRPFLGSLGFLDYSTQMFIIIVVGASSIPLTIIGFLIGSHNTFWRIAGIFVLYGFILIVGSGFWSAIWS